MRILCFGEALVDLVGEAPLGGPLRPRPGGAATRVALAAAAAGGPATLAAAIGDDPWGAWLAQRLREGGVALDALRTVQGTPTTLTLSVDGATSAYAGPGPAGAVKAAAAALEDAGAAVVLVLSPATMAAATPRAATLALRERALAAGGAVVVHADTRRERWPSASAAALALRDLLPGAVLACAGAAAAQALTGERDPEAAAASLLAAGALHAVVQPAEGGALLRGPRLRADAPGGSVAVECLTGRLAAALGQAGGYPPALAAALPLALGA